MVPACQVMLRHCVTCPHVPHACFHTRPSSLRSPRRSNSALHFGCRISISVRARQNPGGSPDDMSSAFAREMASRTEAQEKALEQGEASTFGGRQLLEALQDRFVHVPSADRTAGVNAHVLSALQYADTAEAMMSAWCKESTWARSSLHSILCGSTGSKYLLG